MVSVTPTPQCTGSREYAMDESSCTLAAVAQAMPCGFSSQMCPRMEESWEKSIMQAQHAWQTLASFIAGWSECPALAVVA